MEFNYLNHNNIQIIVGTVVAIAGDNFAVIATDSQMGKNYFIAESRKDKLYELSPVAVMSSAGSWPDALALNRFMETAVPSYEMANEHPINIDVMSHVLSNFMNKRRFLSPSVSTIMAGIDKEGKGAVFSLDSLGRRERRSYQAIGTATDKVLPLLNSSLRLKTAPTETEAVSLVSDCMSIASELGDYSGGYALVKIIKKDGITVTTAGAPMLTFVRT